MGLVYTASLSEVNTHIFEPITRQILNKMINDLGLRGLLDNNIHIKGDTSDVSTSVDNNNNPTLRNNRLTCTIRPNMNIDGTKWDMSTPHHLNGMYMTVRDSRDRDPIFYDQHIDMQIAEKGVPGGIMLECVINFKDNSDAYECLSRITRMYSNTEKILITDLAYDYKLPWNVLAIMHGIYKLNGGEEGKFISYLKQYSLNDINLMVNRNKMEHTEITVSKSGWKTLATIDLNMEKPNSENVAQKPSWWMLEFTITVQFERPDLLLLEYPIVVKNQLVPANLVFVEPERQWGNIVPHHPFIFTENYLRSMPYPEKERLLVKTVNCVRSPWYDNWMLPASSPIRRLRYKPFFISILTLDDVENPDGETIIKLDEPIDEHRSLHPVLIEYLKSIKHMGLFFEDYVHVGVYTNNTLVEPESLSLEDGVTLKIPNRNINKVYRLIISEHPGRRLIQIPTFKVMNVDIVTHI